MSTQQPETNISSDTGVSGQRYERRRVLTRLGIIAGVVLAVGAQVWVLLKLWFGSSNSPTGPVTLGAAEQFVDGSVTHFWKQHVLLVRRGSELLALSDACTHNKCYVDYLPEQRIIFCPCHGSQFSLTGNVLRGPASLPLHRFPVALQQGDVMVDTSRRLPSKNSY
jgi:Rieske Fe-S protein